MRFVVKACRPWRGPLIVFPKHPRIRRDEIWQAGKALARRMRR
jgi:hypothetical protein